MKDDKPAFKKRPYPPDFTGIGQNPTHPDDQRVVGLVKLNEARELVGLPPMTPEEAGLE